MNTGAVQPVEVTDLVTDLQALARRFDPDSFEPHDVRDVVTDLGQAKRLVEGMVILIARRLDDVPQARTRGKGDAAADELARATGTSTGQAKRQMGTSKRLSDQDGVADKVRAGELSSDQAEAVSDAVAADPDAESDLLQAAADQSVNDLKRTCRDRKAAADPNPDATRLRHHQQRRFRSWSESDGEWKAFLSGPADMGARIEAALRSEHDDVFRAAHAAGGREPDAAYRSRSASSASNPCSQPRRHRRAGR